MCHSHLKRLPCEQPLDFIIENNVDISQLKRGFIFSHKNAAQQYFIPNYIAAGYDTQEQYHKGIKEVGIYTGPLYNDYEGDIYVEKKCVKIIYINERHEIDWRLNVDDIIIGNNPYFLFYQLDNKIGRFNENGLSYAEYDAVDISSSIYIAKVQKTNNLYTIRYFHINDNGDIVEITKKEFNPDGHHWFPEIYNDIILSDFKKTTNNTYNHLTSSNNGHEWTAEDAWDAMTDGMYGEMPDDPLMYDAFMDALGF